VLLGSRDEPEGCHDLLLLLLVTYRLSSENDQGDIIKLGSMSDEFMDICQDSVLNFLG
jgi:hypothetical protein